MTKSILRDELLLPGNDEQFIKSLKILEGGFDQIILCKEVAFTHVSNEKPNQ